MEKAVPIKTDSSKFFRQYLEIINPLINITGREADVLAEILHKYYSLSKEKSLSQEYIWTIIFSYDGKQQMREKLKLSDASFANNLTTLRQKGLIVDNKVVKNLLVSPEKIVTVKYQFYLTDIQ